MLSGLKQLIIDQTKTWIVTQNYINTITRFTIVHEYFQSSSNNIWRVPPPFWQLQNIHVLLESLTGKGMYICNPKRRWATAWTQMNPEYVQVRWHFQINLHMTSYAQRITHVYVRVNSQEYCLGLFPFQLTHGLGNWTTAVPGRTGGSLVPRPSIT